jgi:alpha-L-rhamnosidase
MKSYIEFLQKQINPQTGILAEGKPEDWGNLGDWLSPEDNKNDKSLLWEAYFIYDLEIMQKIALALGKNEDAEKFNKLCKQRKEFFNKTYIDPQTGQTIHSGFIASKKNELIGTQVSYVLPLIFNILDKEKEEKVIRNLIMTITGVDRIEFPPYSLLTGFIGTAWINKALSQHQQTDMAYSLFQQTSYPSWLYSVEQGATTIWERLNSYTHTNGFGGNNRMNSFNHYSFGAIGAWMCNHSLGIERDENSPGFKHFILQPEYDPTRQMTYAKGHYDSMYGRIESSWKSTDKDCHYELTVPANTSATLYIQSASPDNITEDGIPLSKVEGVNYVGNENGKCIFKLQSGKYDVRTN